MYESMIVYRSFYEAIKELDDATAAAVFRAMCEYGLNGNEIELQGVSKAIFALIKPQIDANNKRKQNGFKGGRPKAENNQTETKTKPKQNQTETEAKANINLNVNVNKNVKEKKMCSNEHIKEIADEWNATFANTDVPKVTILKPGSKRAKMLQARLEEFGKEKVIDAMKTAAESSFLTSSSWFSFDWFCCPSNFVKIIEGNYKDHAQQLQTFSPSPKRGSAAELQNFYDAAAKWAEGG